MCGRYYRQSDKQRIAEAFKVGKLPPGFELPPDYNDQSFLKLLAAIFCGFDVTAKGQKDTEVGTDPTDLPESTLTPLPYLVVHRFRSTLTLPATCPLDTT
jgi:hypothetical protein